MDSIALQGLIKKRMVIINSQEKAFTESKNHFYRRPRKIRIQ
ncbi:Uncharacterised protein [Salmonella enterica subsp. diarizonae]|nr:Uncharacterised protein [Salmonella enterica subsp. diarizonae]